MPDVLARFLTTPEFSPPLMRGETGQEGDLRRQAKARRVVAEREDHALPRQAIELGRVDSLRAHEPGIGVPVIIAEDHDEIGRDLFPRLASHSNDRKQ